MNELLNNIIITIVTVIVIPLLSYLSKKIINYIELKTSNLKEASMLNKINDIITTAVLSVFQTYVDNLKKNEVFDKDAQVEALNKALNIANQQLSDEIKDYIATNYGDINAWIISRIESVIAMFKDKK